VEEWAAAYQPALVEFSPGAKPFMAVHGPQEASAIDFSNITHAYKA
jgi:hypothetical protein